mmetsp:Transcript_29828/g.39038  ORF Transcript_29828/g.39038 Transcript_29828/m.39038 type:complete len:269 (+) Transcript_29828:55-861(+)
MTVTVKKAGEVAVKTASKAIAGQRAVSASEAPNVKPAMESTKSTMMPWKGWVESFLKDKLGPERFQKYRELVYYKPDDIHDLNQIPFPSTKIPISKDDPKMTAQFRHPSPGSQPPVRIPSADPGTTQEDPFNTSYYTRDTGRRGLDPAWKNPELERVKVELMNPNDPDVEDLKAKLEAGPESSPGNSGRFATGPSDFDTTNGLRATMSANHEALEASLDANMPDHLPYPEWYDKQDELVAWYEERDLPVPFGATGYGTVPREGRIARW